MPATSLHHILTARRVDIISSVSAVSASTPRLNALQDVALNCLLSFLENENRTELEEKIAASSKNAAIAHSLGDQLIAMDKLETVILELSKDALADKEFVGILLHISEFFRDIRRAIVDVYSERHLEITQHFYSGYMKKERGEPKEALAELIQNEKLSALSELISGIAHELNNPLTGIIGYTQLLLESTSDTTSRNKLEKVCNEGLRCKRIIENLLKFACHYKPKKSVIDINSVIQSAVNLKEQKVESDGIDLRTDFCDSSVRLLCDPHQLQQVIMNLIDNARQAIIAGGVGETIEVRTSKDGENNRVWILVIDDGPGISPEHLPKVFDPFFTTKETGQGTGLGLSVAYGIVQEHGGQISVESVSGKRTVFHIQLPLTEENRAVFGRGSTPAATARNMQ
jgi:signal transduction histidine kinase